MKICPRLRLAIPFIMFAALVLTVSAPSFASSSYAAYKKERELEKERERIAAQKKLEDELNQRILVLTQDLSGMHENIESCSNRSDRVLRLQCYDQLAEHLGYISPEKRAEEGKILGVYGFWEASSSRNDMGEVYTYLKVKPNAAVFTNRGIKKFPELVLRCKTNVTDVYLDWRGPLVANNVTKSLHVGYRLDAEEKVSEPWEVSLDMHAVFSPRAIEFVRELKRAKKVSLELTPYDDRTHVVNYVVEGLESGLELLAKRCYN